MLTKERKAYPCVIYSHSTTWHDGAVAMLLPSGKIYSLAAERVGDRRKHSWDSRLAYDYLRERLPEYKKCFGSETDFFVNPGEDDLFVAHHHLNHAASAFYGSPYKNAAVLIVDGQGPEEGDWVATSLWNAEGDKLKLLEIPHRARGLFLPQSVGHFYTAISALAGMKHLHEEGKTMGLAAHGKPSRFLECFKQYAYSNEDGSYHIDPLFIYAVLGNTFGPRFFGWGPQPFHVQQVWEYVTDLRSTPIRETDRDFTQDDMNIAYAGQYILEEIMLGLVRRIKEKTRKNNLCMAGGVALNCAANRRIVESGIFKNVFVFPVSEDSGQPLGKLYHYVHEHGIGVSTRMKTVYLGPDYTGEEIRTAVESDPRITVLSSKLDDVIVRSARELAEGKVIGWFQGRSEVGPRALGNRSILADPRRREMQDFINTRIKHREWFRPVAPAVVEEAASQYFVLDRPSPFMLVTALVRPGSRSVIPAVVHVDNTARVQTVQRSHNPRFHRLLAAFGKLTGIPMLINTSFNTKDDPIVETPREAVKSFLSMHLDALVLDRYFLVKSE